MEIVELLREYTAHPQVAALKKLLEERQTDNISLKGLNGSSAALITAALAEAMTKTVTI